MSGWAKPGVKCVCIENAMGSGSWWGDAPVVGHIYTVRRVWTDFEGDTVLEFDELKRSRAARRFHRSDLGYNIARFKPLITRKTEAEDVALFTHHLEMGEPVVVGGVSYRSLGRV